VQKTLLLILLLEVVCGTLGVSPVSAQIPQTLERPAIEGFTADQIVDFAEQLMREGEYFRAITEYRRFLFYYPQDPRQAMVHFRIGLAFYRGQRYGDALQIFREVAQRYPNTSYGKQAWLWQGESLLQQAQYGAAAQVYIEILQQFPHDEVGQQARYQQGWTFLYRRQWQDAARQFQQVAPDSPLYRAAQHLAEEAIAGEQIAPKSPVVAGALSAVIPGSGQLYNGRIGDALLAFLLNSLFIAGITQAVIHQEVAVAGVLSFFEVGWYAGNVYSAINGAHKENRYAVETYLRNLEGRFRLPLAEVP
jgi:TolA-binding protein/TM2 domain-containing membrane protein YozV